MPELNRGILLVVFGNATQFVLLLLTMRVATTLLPPDEMGRLSLLNALTAFFALFLVNPAGMFLNRRLHTWNSTGRAKAYLKWHWVFLLGVSLVAGIVVVILNYTGLLTEHFSTSWLLILVCGSLFFNTINQTAIPSLNLLEYREPYVFLTLGTVSFGLSFAYFLTVSIAPDAELWLAGLLVGQAVFALVGVIRLFGLLDEGSDVPFPSKAQFRSLLSFAIPVAISVGLTWIQTQGFRFFISDSLGLASLGMFVAGYGISAGLVAAYESVVTTYFQPRFYKAISGGDVGDQPQAWKGYANTILPSLVLVVTLLIVMAPELTRIMLGPAYQSASVFVIWGALAEGTRVTAGVYGMSAHAKMKTKLLMIPSAFGAMTCMFLIFVLAPFYGVHGVGLARTLSGAVLIVALHRMLSSDRHLELPWTGIGVAILMSGVLWICASGVRWLLNGTLPFLNALALVSLIGALFLAMFYWLLRPMLHRTEIQL